MSKSHLSTLQLTFDDSYLWFHRKAILKRCNPSWCSLWITFLKASCWRCNQSWTFAGSSCSSRKSARSTTGQAWKVLTPFSNPIGFKMKSYQLHSHLSSPSPFPHPSSPLHPHNSSLPPDTLLSSSSNATSNDSCWSQILVPTAQYLRFVPGLPLCPIS